MLGWNSSAAIARSQNQRSTSLFVKHANAGGRATITPATANPSCSQIWPFLGMRKRRQRKILHQTCRTDKKAGTARDGRLPEAQLENSTSCKLTAHSLACHAQRAHSGVEAGAFHAQDLCCTTRPGNPAARSLEHVANVASLNFFQGRRIGKGVILFSLHLSRQVKLHLIIP